MKKPGRNNLILAWIVAYLLVALLCLKAGDSLLTNLLENVTSIKLAGQAQSDVSVVSSEVQQSDRQAEQVRLRVAALATRQIPSLDDLKALQSQHRLRLIQMERVSGATRGEGDIISYRTVLSGTVGAVVRFLKELEDQYLVQSDQITIIPANEDGSQVNLTITVGVSSP